MIQLVLWVFKNGIETDDATVMEISPPSLRRMVVKSGIRTDSATVREGNPPWSIIVIWNGGLMVAKFFQNNWGRCPPPYPPSHQFEGGGSRGGTVGFSRGIRERKIKIVKSNPQKTTVNTLWGRCPPPVRGRGGLGGTVGSPQN